MLRSAASKAMWIGRTTSAVVCLAPVLALLFGASSTALGANGKPFLLGKKNVATAVSKLVKKGTGPALNLQVGSGPPLAVNSSEKVENLNATLLDGKSSADFAPTAAEPWREVGTTGEPAFQNRWTNGGITGGGPYSTAAFYKDPYGAVHLKGLVMGPNTPSVIFGLSCGYGPAQEEWHATYSRGADASDVLGRAEIRPVLREDGSYRADVVAGRGYTVPFSLDGITFRAHGS